MTDPVAIAVVGLLGSLFGGVALKFVDLISTRLHLRDENSAKQLLSDREELAKFIADARDRVTKLESRNDLLEQRVFEQDHELTILREEKVRWEEERTRLNQRVDDLSHELEALRTRS